MTTVTYISQKDSELLHEELTPQFLGLWVKMYKEDIPADLGKRAMAFALFKTCSYLQETKNLGDSENFISLCKELGSLIDKYSKKGLHYAQISASLELQITNILGTRAEVKSFD